MTIAFVGGGNMARALIGGLRKSDTAGRAMLVIEPDPAKRRQLELDFAVATAAAPADGLRLAEIVVLAVKPQQMAAVCAELRPWLAAPLVVSIAAGIRAGDLARWLGNPAVVRAMPNTPALVGHGASGLAALPSVSQAQRSAAEAILRAVGEVVWLADESLLDAVTALSGSGPAYVFYLLEALIAAGTELGLSSAQARQLAVHTVLGTGMLAAQSDEPMATLREQVTSKGGTTAAAIESLQADQVGAALIKAVRAAQRRAVELGDEFGRQ